VAVLKVCYKPGVRFDEQYYLSTHVPLATAYFTRFGVTQVEVLRCYGLSDLPPAYQVIITARFSSMAGLQQALAHPDLAQVLADVPNYYDGVPDVLVGEPVAMPV
jgi:uncharacterized protein (TIGR02118 family)